jgi:hypothetical protein
MRGEIYDYPTRFLVDSESVTGDSYLVELVSYKLFPKENGSCTCPSFLYSCAPRLKNQDNVRLYRCKHILFAREKVLDFLIKELDERDPNHKPE